MRIKLATPSGARICLLGGTGFVGGHLATRLATEGYKLRIITRRRERHRDLLVIPEVEIVEADVFDAGALRQVFSDCQIVINLVAILNERRRGDFENVHVRLPRNIVQACLETGIRRLLHISALNADAKGGKSRYLITKGKGEDLLHGHTELQVTSFRPSVIFGPNDHFFNRFAQLLRATPWLFPLACPNAEFAPIYVNDLADAITACIHEESSFGQRYEVCGPHVYTLKQLVEFTRDILRLKRIILPLGDGLSLMQAIALGLLPGKPFSYDNYLSLQSASVCSDNVLSGFVTKPRSVEQIVPDYLLERNQKRRLDQYRNKSRHTY